MLREPQGLARLRQLGARSIPVVAKGERWVWAQNVRDLADFLGMGDRIQAPLPAVELIERWIVVLGAALRCMQQYPPGLLDERVIPVRERTVRMLTLHVFRIVEGFLDAAECEWKHDPLALELGDDVPGLREHEELLGYAERIVTRLETWKGQFDFERANARMDTVAGPLSVLAVLERSTWHSAQHVRQLQFVLERCGLVVDGPLGDRELGGLPLPERLFE